MTQRAEPCDQVLLTIRKIIRAVDVHSKKLRTKTGVTGPQLILLKEIYEANGHITTTKLAENVSLSQSTVTNILDRLVEKNFVTRTRDSVDKRVWFLELTKEAIDKVDTAPTMLQQEFIDKFSSLPEWQQTQMISTLQRIASMMDNHSENKVEEVELQEGKGVL